MRCPTTPEAAALLHVDPSRVRLLCQRGRINTITIGNTYAIPEGELERFAAIPRRAGRPRRGKPASRHDSAAVRFEHRVLSSQ